MKKIIIDNYRYIFYLISLTLRLIAFLKNYFFSQNFLKVTKLPVPIISVGNISLGGTGKTPLVIRIAEEAKRHNFNVGIISRGYRRIGKNLVIVHNGKSICSDVEKSGDEPYLMAKIFKDIPIISDSNRIRGSYELINRFKVNLIILDDGFQHRKIFRNIDIVTINANENYKMYNMFPVGNLRESLFGLNRADYIFVNKGTMENLPKKKKLQIFKNGKTFFSFSKFELRLNNRIIKESPKSPMIAFCAIADPDYFFNSVINNGINLCKKLSFNDHDPYKKNTINVIEKMVKLYSVSCLITTEKDYYKLPKYFTKKYLVYVQVFRIGGNDKIFKQIINSLK